MANAGIPADRKDQSLVSLKRLALSVTSHGEMVTGEQ